MDKEHNQAEAIAKIVCRYCLDNKSINGDRLFRELLRTPARVERSYQVLCRLGGSRRFTEPKASAVFRAYLYTPEFFKIVAANIELMCRFDDGSVRYWDGNGAKRFMCIEDTYEDYQKYLGDAGAAETLSPLMEYQVNIAAIWKEVSPYLES
jgi:hypothetical protein